ncbi:MAG: hypothetical protein RBT36_06360 [Desulfobulbus sp.]|jgi:hypothetical protein|nr:hypothetical protein [Desulfobulbus sp.]
MNKRILITLLTVGFLASTLMLTGCSSMRKSRPVDDVGGLPQVASFADDIKDINVPSELIWDRKSSMSIKTESFRGGIWQYNGRTEILSLKDYLVNSMRDNKWKLVGETTSKDIMLAFTKPSQTCMMVISDGLFGRVSLTLYISIDKTAAAGMNPFGEPVNQ